MAAAAGQVELQPLKPPLQPAWYTPANGKYDNARTAFALGTLQWRQETGFVARLFNDLYIPNFADPRPVSGISPSVWITPPVELQSVVVAAGWCRSTGLRFEAVTSERPLTGMAIYVPSTGQMVFAGSGYFGNLPVTQQDVYVQYPGAKGWFRQ